MRKLFLPVAVGMLLGWAAPAAAAPVPIRDCGSRGEGPRPVTRLARPGDLKIGPVAFAGLARVANRRAFDRFRSNGRFLMKAPLFVRARRVVTVTITPLGSATAGLTFDNDAPVDTGVPTVKFFACDEDQRAFSYDGVVGPVTVFPGGFTLSEPQCAVLRVRVRGRRLVYRRLVSFGMGPARRDCDKL